MPSVANMCRLPIDGRVCPACERRLLDAATHTQTTGGRTKRIYPCGIQILLDWLGPRDSADDSSRFFRGILQGGLVPGTVVAGARGCPEGDHYELLRKLRRFD